MTTNRKLKLGVIGLGRAGGGILSAMDSAEQIELVAGADKRPHALETFQSRYGGRVYDDAEKLCHDPDVEAVWIATPNEFHCPHAVMAAEHGKHIVVEKPMSLSLDESQRMIESADRNGVKLLSGHTRAFDPPVQAMRQIINSGELGKLCALNVMAFTDWMLRPRMPEEVDASRGGGVAFRQAPHQVDTLRFLGGGMVRTVRAMTGQWMQGRTGAPGYYSAFLQFEDGTPATMVYNGYGYFLASDLLGWPGDAGSNPPEDRAKVRRALQKGELDEAQAKDATRLGGAMQGQGYGFLVGRAASASTAEGPRRPRFLSDLGILIVTCERGDIRQSPNGVYVYDDDGVREVPLTANDPGTDPTLTELYNAVVLGHPVIHDGPWGMATLEVQKAMMESAAERREVQLKHQVPVRGAAH